VAAAGAFLVSSALVESYSGMLALGAFILSRGVGAGFLASFAGSGSASAFFLSSAGFTSFLVSAAGFGSAFFWL